MTDCSRPSRRSRHRRAAAFAGAALLAVSALSARPVAAQGGGLPEQCPPVEGQFQAPSHCERVAYAIGIIQPRLAVLTAGGNPVPGTASTLGTRLGSLPRFSVGGRVSGVTLEIPAVATAEGGAPRGLNTLAVNVDGALGVFSGVPLLPTVGGFGSIDALASAGVVLAAGNGFARASAFTWAAGARVGILRESFTMPGLSVSGMYRRIGTVEYGDPALTRYATHFTIDGTSVVSARAAVSKRIHVINATAGAGWDRTTSDVSWVVRPQPSAITPPPAPRRDALRSDRAHAFLNAAWTLFIVNFAGEIGVHPGGDGSGAPDAVRGSVEKRGIYGSVAARLAI